MRRVAAALAFAFLSAAQNFRRNLAVSLAGVVTMGLILLMVGSTLLFTHTINQLLDQQQTKASKLRIYLKDGVSLASISHLETALRRDPRVLSVSFENKDAAKKENSLTNPNLGHETDVVGFNPLPASLNVTSRQLKDLQSLSDEASAQALVDPSQHTDYQRDVVSKLQDLITKIQVFGIGISLVLGFISLVIIMNAIRTAVFVRRTEIEIMKLVGATDWFVRWPFILEGVLGGVLAASLSGIIVAIAYRALTHNVNAGLFAGIPYDGGFLTFLVGIIVAAGIALGGFGSYLGVRRFLAV